MSPHLPPSLLQLLRPASPECSDKSTSDRHFVTWTDQEDEILRQAVRIHGTDKWSVIAAQFRSKTSRQCRRRWHTYLSTDCKKGGWSPEEDQLLLEAHRKYGNRWTEIAKVVPGRTDNAVKNRFCALGKKQAREMDVTSSQSSGELSTDEGRALQKRRVLEQNNNITNKKCRGDYVQSRPHDTVLQQKQPHIQIKSSQQTWTTDESLARRAHPLRRVPVLQSGKTVKVVSHTPDKGLQGSKGLKYQGLSKLAHDTTIDTPVLSQGSGTVQVLSSFSENVSPRLAALTQNAELLDSLVERRDARLRHWGGAEDTWKAFDWLTVQDGGKTLQTTSFAPRCLLPLDGMKEAFYEGKENYIDLSQFPLGSQFISTLPLLRDPIEHKQQQDIGSVTPVVRNERAWKLRAEFEGLDCSSPSNTGSLQVEDSSPTQNDHFSPVQVDQSMHSEQNKLLLTEKGTAPVTCGTEAQGIMTEEDKTKEVESPLTGSSFGDMPSPINFTPDSQFLIDGMPSPQFSDSEKQFLLSALDSSYPTSVLDSPSLSNTSLPFYCTSF